jgi:hypothetical protein
MNPKFIKTKKKYPNPIESKRGLAVKGYQNNLKPEEAYKTIPFDRILVVLQVKV